MSKSLIITAAIALAAPAIAQRPQDDPNAAATAARVAQAERLRQQVTADRDRARRQAALAQITPATPQQPDIEPGPALAPVDINAPESARQRTGPVPTPFGNGIRTPWDPR